MHSRLSGAYPPYTGWISIQCLLRCLAVIDKHARTPLPAIVHRYLVSESLPGDQSHRLSHCVERHLVMEGVRHIGANTLCS
jgi:hypothetical protein